jgi:hypothetical protein
MVSAVENFKHARENAKPDCPKCHGTGAFKYDHNHSTICGRCCKHDRGFWFLTEGYQNAGNWCCLAGCGFVLPFNPLGHVVWGPFSSDGGFWGSFAVYQTVPDRYEIREVYSEELFGWAATKDLAIKHASKARLPPTPVNPERIST